MRAGAVWQRAGLGALVVCLQVIPANAHDVWITTAEVATGAVTAMVNHGHPGDRKTPDPDKLFEFDLVLSEGPRRSLLSSVRPAVHEGIPILETAPIAISQGSGMLLLAARYDNGYWVKTAHGYRNTSRRQVSGTENSLYSMKYAKALVRGGAGQSEAYRTIVGHRLELIPLSNPFTLTIGQRLQVRVLYEGNPAADVQVEIGDGVTPMQEKDIPRYSTDKDGVAAIPITKAGMQLLVVDHVTPSTHPELAASELSNATLSFVLQPSEGRASP